MLPEICDALERANITTPFAIQEMTLSVALLGTDLIGQARTGTGKTLAFGIPVLQRSVAPKDPDYSELPQGKPQALIVAPTRELALQVSSDLALASADRGLRVLTVYGGVGYDTQLDTLEAGVDIVVGTPGRLIDLCNRKALDISHVHALVLDEADEMLDLGFLPDVERILRMTPETRQTMLFSATMPAAIVALARTHMRHPMNIRAESSYDTTMVPATAQFIYQVHDLDKPEIIGRVLQAEDAGKIIVFTRTKRQAQRVAEDLAERGFSSSPLHGDMAQIAREKALTRFREDKLRVLVATDVAARGIDVAGVSHVINYSCPEDDKTYVHRIGRTGRAGASGIAITFVDWQDLHRWKMINKTLDLPFDEPQETYSTSEHLFHDQGIAPDTKGRIGEPKPAPEKPERRDRDRGERSGDRPQGNRNRNRSRSRTRSGQPVAEGDAPAADAGKSGEDKPSGSGNRNRRRRRRSSGGGWGPVLRADHRLTDQEHADPPELQAGRRDFRRSVGDDDGRAERGELPEGDGVLALLADAAVRERRAEVGDRLDRLALVDRDVVEPDGGPVAVGEAHEVLHAAGVVDPPRLLGSRVDGVGPGIEVVLDAAGDEVRASYDVAATDQPDPLAALAEHDPATVAGVGRQRLLGGRLVDLRLELGCGACWHRAGLGAGLGAGRGGRAGFRRGRLPVRGLRGVRDRATGRGVGRRRERAGAAEDRHEGDRERGRGQSDPAVARPDPSVAGTAHRTAHRGGAVARAARFAATSR